MSVRLAAALAAVLAVASLAPVPTHAQMPRDAVDTEPPRITALRAQEAAPRVDGRLDDAVWATAPVATDFRQDFPDDGESATERTEVRVIYDTDAVYVAARMFDSDPSGIIGRLERRDSDSASDRFVLSIDSYHDHRTAFRFAVNPAGVRSDYLATNDSDSEDFSWDPVWEVVTRVDEQGWTAEMRIPFSQLRFSTADEQTWGVNFTRLVFRKTEWSAWSWWANEEQGFASHFGHLDGLRGLSAPRRVEVLPYTVVKTDHVEGADTANPFHDGSRQTVTAGVDVNIGVTSDLTLNATVNPDFGQVEADPAEVNLTAFETFFDERRPFFVEGANLFQFGAGSGGFSFGAPQLFYSRRIGRPPSGPVFESGGFVDNPINTSILAAAKLSGQTGGWSIGVMDALTGNEHARVQAADGSRRTDLVEPRANFGVVSLRRDLRGGSSSIGILGTSVNRSLDHDSFRFLSSSAYTGGVDFFHRFADNKYVVNGTFAASRVAGDPLAMYRLQRSSARYYQRPDQDYVSVDSSRTSLSGYTVSGQFDKVSGNWLFGTDFFAYSPGFEANDAGFLTSVDQVFHGVRLTRRWLTPGDVFRSFQINATGFQTWNYGGARTGRGVFLGVNGRLLNYWGGNARFQYNARNMSVSSTRGGPLVLQPANWNAGGSVFNDFRSKVSGHAYGRYARNEFDGWGVFLGGGIGWRARDGLSINVFPNFSRTHTIGQYVIARVDPLAEATFGSRYLYAELRQNSFSATIRMDMSLTPDISLQWYAQPFVATGDYQRFKELRRPESYDFLVYGEDGSSTISETDGVYRVDSDGTGASPEISFGNPDFRIRSIQSNLVFRWEYVPGSTLFLVWNHGRSGFSPDPTFRVLDELGGIWDDDMQNTVILKLNYWISR